MSLPLAPDASRPRTPAELAHRVRRNFATLDAVALLLMGWFTVGLVLAPDSTYTDESRPLFYIALSLTVLIIITVRGELVPPGRVRGIVYRCSLMFTLIGTYMFGMRAALHALQPVEMDAQLAALDRALFGVVPAQWMEQFASVALTEWLAFWYFCFFLMLCLAIVPPVFRGVDRVSAERLFGLALIVTVGHIGYTLVPGRGPYAFLEFAGPVEGGLFWGLCVEAVRTSGPLIDIFPSLHTGFTLFIAVHTLRYPRGVLRWTGPLALFASLNIIVATIYLRWHYAVDVVAGIALALASVWISRWVIDRDVERVRQGRQPTFCEAIEPLPTSAVGAGHPQTDPVRS